MTYKKKGLAFLGELGKTPLGLMLGMGIAVAIMTAVVVPVLSGGNIDALLLLEVIRHGLASGGRFLMFRVRISDRPGELMRLLTALAEMDVNILNVHHDRGSEALGVREVEVALQVATRGPEHRADVWRRLVELGYDPI